MTHSHMKCFLCIGPSTYFQHLSVSMYSLFFHYHHMKCLILYIYLLPGISSFLSLPTHLHIHLVTQILLRFSSSMACNYPICTTTLLGAMDSLWFQQLILHHLPDPISVPESVSSESFTSSCQSSSSCTSITEQDYALSDQSPLTPQQSFNSELEQREKIVEEVLKQTRPSRLSRSKTRSHPSRLSRSRRYTGSAIRLQKTMSCKTLGELEVEEVKGFMELGFSFDSQYMCPRMMSVLPGLQRLGAACNNDKEIIDQELVGAGVENEKKSESGVYRRPYLSEAWLIRRPDSPLLNLRIPRNSKAADMKKHLKSWARTVASVVHQDS